MSLHVCIYSCLSSIIYIYIFLYTNENGKATHSPEPSNQSHVVFTWNGKPRSHEETSSKAAHLPNIPTNKRTSIYSICRLSHQVEKSIYGPWIWEFFFFASIYFLPFFCKYVCGGDECYVYIYVCFLLLSVFIHNVWTKSWDVLNPSIIEGCRSKNTFVPVVKMERDECYEKVHLDLVNLAIPCWKRQQHTKTNKLHTCF